MPPFFQTYVGLKTICKFTTKLEQKNQLTLGLKFLLPAEPASCGRFVGKTCKSLGEGNHLKVAMSEGSPLL